MAEKKIAYFTAKISATDFLTGMAALYGPIENLKFQWVENIMRDIEGNWDAQLNGITKIGMSSTGIEYEINLWDFYYREPELEEFRRIEQQFAISQDIQHHGQEVLPLSAISVKASNLEGESKIPLQSAFVWLHYGDLE